MPFLLPPKAAMDYYYGWATGSVTNPADVNPTIDLRIKGFNLINPFGLVALRNALRT